MRLQFKVEVFGEPVLTNKIVFDVFFAPKREQLCRFNLQSIYTGVRLRSSVVPFQQLESGILSPAREPAIYQPLRVRITQSGAFLLELIQQGPRCVMLPEVTAQNRVYESGLWPEPALFGQFDGNMHRGVIGDPVEPKNLVQTEAQEVLQSGLLDPVSGLASDQPIEGGLPANDAVHEFLAQPPVYRREACPGQCAVQQFLCEVPFAAVAQDLNRNFSWFLPAHYL